MSASNGRAPKRPDDCLCREGHVCKACMEYIEELANKPPEEWADSEQKRIDRHAKAAYERGWSGVEDAVRYAWVIGYAQGMEDLWGSVLSTAEWAGLNGVLLEDAMGL